MFSFQSRPQCSTSQGIRGQFQHHPSKPQTAYTSFKRSEMPRAQTANHRMSKPKDTKKMLFEACNQIGKVFPKEKFILKNNDLDLNGIKSEGVRIAIFELQYVLVKRGYYDDDIRNTLIKLAQRVSRQLTKGMEFVNTVEVLKTQNATLKSQMSGNRHIHQNLNSQGKRKLLKSTIKHDTKAFLQNSKLQHLNKELVKMVQKFHENENINPTINSNQSGITNDWRMQDFRNKISYLELKLVTEEKSYSQLMTKLENQQIIARQACEEVKKLKQQNTKLKQTKQQWMQRALMQLEDKNRHSANLLKKQPIYTSFKKKDSKKQEIRKKSQAQIQIKVPLERRLLFQYQMDFFKSIRTYYYQNKAACYKMNVCWRADQLGVNYQKSQSSQSQSESQVELTPLPQLSYYRPSFYSFIQHLHKRDQSNYQLSRSLIQKMRCIMQSKINEFLVYEDVHKYTRFPEFVYSWFKKYYFDSDKKCIVESLCEEESGYQSFKFYKDLMNVKLDQTWQVVTFRQFLLEEEGLECLYFYSHCQNILYKRSGITEEIQYMGEFVVLVKYSVAKAVLDVILSQFDSWNVQFLVGKMNEKVILVKNQEFIESAFFLRCLLEYYKIERMNRYKYIRKAACQLRDNEKFPSLNYLQCMKVLSKFPDITEGTRLQIYRDCYSVGRGMITPQIIFTVCTQNRVFLKYLKIKSFYKLPVQINKNYESGSLFCLQPPHPYLYKIFSKMKTLLMEGSPFSRKVMNLGIEDISYTVDYYRKYFLQWKSYSDNGILKCKHFLHFVKECLSIVSLINYHQLHQLIGDQWKLHNKISLSLNENEIGQIYSEDTDNMIQMVQNTVGLLEWKSKLQRFRQNISAKKIQRMIRKKFLEPYIQIYNVMFDKVKKVKYLGVPN